MHRIITFKKPIRYKTLNGTKMAYDCLIVTYSKKGNLQLKLSRQLACPEHQEIRITTDNITVPKNCVALRPTMPCAERIFPELFKRNILIPHVKKKSIQKNFVNYPLYELVIPKYTTTKYDTQDTSNDKADAKLLKQATG